MERSITLPFSERCLKYLKNYEFEGSTALKIMNNTQKIKMHTSKNLSYFWIIERCFLFDTLDKTLLNELSYMRRHAFILFDTAKWFFCQREFQCLINLYLHYTSAHSKMHTKVNIKKERKRKSVFFVIQDYEPSNMIEDHFGNYTMKKSFYESYTKRSADSAGQSAVRQMLHPKILRASEAGKREDLRNCGPVTAQISTRKFNDR